MILEFTAAVKAQPQGSMKGQRNPKTGKIRITTANDALYEFRDIVGWEASRKITRKPMFTKHVPLLIFLTFVFVRPKSVSGDREFPVVKPDIDKLQRAVFDALTDIAYHDDAQVVQVFAKKEYGNAAYVKVRLESVE